MKRYILILGAWAGVATASDKPVVGPVPSWVKVATLPALPKSDQAAVQILLQDQQVHFEGGARSTYSENVTRLQTPEGLAAGNISFAWNPEQDTPVVHKLVIRRGDRTIDVLASQSFTVIRRETNLEAAMLDGVLTATIQPEGLQVGDIVDFQISIASQDPVLGAHAEQIGGGWNGVPIGRARLRALWPAALPMRLRQGAGLTALQPLKEDGMVGIEFTSDDLRPLVMPAGAPPRYQIARLVEMTDYKSWSDLAATLAPLYAKAGTLPATGPLADELVTIKALSPDPVRRTEAALALVQERVRYLYLGMNAGGLTPADAATTWSRRFGDCKAKTALLLALLRGLGIEAEAVIVSTELGDGLDQRLPMAALFDHVLVRAVIGSRTYWLDGTRTGDHALAQIKTPAFGWGLPLLARNAALVRMLPPPLDRPAAETSIRIDATAGITLPAPIHVERTIRGDGAIAFRNGLANLTPEVRDAGLRSVWRSELDFVEITKVDATFDAATGEERLTMDGMATMAWKNGWFETNGTSLGYQADFHRDPGPDKDAPFAVPYPLYRQSTETILLPPSFGTATAKQPADVAQVVAGTEYKRQTRFSGNGVVITSSTRTIAPEFPAADAPAAQAALRKLADDDVYLRRPVGYQSSAGEVAALLAKTPATADEFVDRGNTLLDEKRYDEAISDLGRALALDPKNVNALADRGLAFIRKNDLAAAEKDLTAAAEIDPNNAVAYRGRGLLALIGNKPEAAVAAFTRALEIEPGSSFALGNRARAYFDAGDNVHALVDAAEALKIFPQWYDLYLLRANALRRLGRANESTGEADAIAAAGRDSGYAQVVAAKIYAAQNKTDEAMRAYSRALAIKPESYIYLNRAELYPRTDVAARTADLDAALKLDPKNASALVAKARVDIDAGQVAPAVALLTNALSIETGDAYLLTQRGIAYTRIGERASAAKDFAAARATAGTARELNNLCWAKATDGVALESALDDCTAAIAADPESPAALDSRGLVLLRLGRIDGSIADYDHALAKRPKQASSLYGRALAHARQGDKALADADFAAAKAADPHVVAEFEGYGLKP